MLSTQRPHAHVPSAPAVADTPSALEDDGLETSTISVRWALLAGALALGTAGGCGGAPDVQTPLADPPPPVAAVPTKATPRKPPPKFGSPPAERKDSP
jgi:hypothetical protein